MTRACFPDTPGQCIPLGKADKSEGLLPILLCFTVLGTQEHQEMTHWQAGESEMECMADWSQRHRVAVVQYSITLLPAVAHYSKTSLPSVMVIALVSHRESNRSQKKVLNKHFDKQQHWTTHSFQWTVPVDHIVIWYCVAMDQVCVVERGRYMCS